MAMIRAQPNVLHKSISSWMMTLRGVMYQQNLVHQNQWNDQEVHFLIILRWLRLFLINKDKEESILSFIHCVHEDIEYANVDSVTKEDIAMLIIVGNCSVVELQKRWGMDKQLSLNKIICEAESFTQNIKMMEDKASSPAMGRIQGKVCHCYCWKKPS